MYLSDEGGPDWRYGYANEAAVSLADGDSFDVGRIRFDVLHTPGHTPEHLDLFRDRHRDRRGTGGRDDRRFRLRCRRWPA